MYMVSGGRKIYKIIFKFREEESSSRADSKLIIGNQEVVDQNKIRNEIQLFYKNLFKSNFTKSYDCCKKFLVEITTSLFCEGDLVKSELFNH